MSTKTKALATDRRAVSYQLREAILASGSTAYRLGQSAGVDPGIIQRFVNDERSLTLPTLDRVALALGLRLVETGRRRGRPAKPRPVGARQATGPASDETADEARLAIEVEAPLDPRTSESVGSQSLTRPGPEDLPGPDIIEAEVGRPAESGIAAGVEVGGCQLAEAHDPAGAGPEICQFADPEVCQLAEPEVCQLASPDACQLAEAVPDPQYKAAPEPSPAPPALIISTAFDPGNDGDSGPKPDQKNE
jgi:hypothetical protein